MTSVGLWSEFGAICFNEMVSSLTISMVVRIEALFHDTNGVMRPL